MIKVLAAFCVLALSGLTNADTHARKLYNLVKTKHSRESPEFDPWSVIDDSTTDEDSPIFIGPQEGLAELDKISELPGQPEGVDFNQYSGYVTVNQDAGRALFYYFVESPKDSSNKPLVLWLNGGPGCSSLFGAMTELGPFRINSDAKTLFRNKYAWSNVANVLFLECPAGVGFSYSNTTSDYDHPGDKKTADDSYIFLINWLERFPQYKTHDFYITGESYAGHYVPQLAYTILRNNKKTKENVINIKGIAIGNAWIDDEACTRGMFDYWWSHALNSDETHDSIFKYCNFVNDSSSSKCHDSARKAWGELGKINVYNIYAPICLNHEETVSNSRSSNGSIDFFDPCWEDILVSYLSDSAVQKAFHARPTSWDVCREYIPIWNDSAVSILPILKYLIENGQRVWVFSGDTDARVPITSSRYAINIMNLPIEKAWQPWYLNEEVGGYLEEYKGLLLITIRGAGHSVPSFQPLRAFVMFTLFLQGIIPAHYHYM